MTSEEIIHVVADRQVDLGIISGDIDTDHLQTLPLISSQLVLITPKMHPLLEIENITLIDIIEYSVVTLNEGSAIQQFLYKLALQLDKKSTSEFRFQATIPSVKWSLPVPASPSFRWRHFSASSIFIPSLPAPKSMKNGRSAALKSVQ